jgi:carbamoyl-phosphate synthase large subunit
MNVQFAVKNDTAYVLEVNPRASRTVPFVAKAIGVPLVKFAARVMAGEKLADIRIHRGSVDPAHRGEAGTVFTVLEAPGADAGPRPGNAVDR